MIFENCFDGWMRNVSLEIKDAAMGQCRLTSKEWHFDEKTRESDAATGAPGTRRWTWSFEEQMTPPRFFWELHCDGVLMCRVSLPPEAFDDAMGDHFEDYIHPERRRFPEDMPLELMKKSLATALRIFFVKRELWSALEKQREHDSSAS
jgi:hypothetical protein